MKTLILRIIAVNVIIMNCSGIEFIEIPKSDIKPPEHPPPERRFWVKNYEEYNMQRAAKPAGFENDHDERLKLKISTLIDQTIYDTDHKIKSVQEHKDYNRQQLPYKIGFILSMVKKMRDTLNALFNDAVKHRDEWKALEQLKMYELIVHTNVDTTNLVRQLVELHIQNLQNGRRVAKVKK